MGRDVRRVPSDGELAAGSGFESSAASGWQIWESVTLGGSPISPVFDTREKLLDWLVNVGDRMGIGGRTLRMSPAAAERFVNRGHSETFEVTDSGIRSGLGQFEDPS